MRVKNKDFKNIIKSFNNQSIFKKRQIAKKQYEEQTKFGPKNDFIIEAIDNYIPRENNYLLTLMLLEHLPLNDFEKLKDSIINFKNALNNQIYSRGRSLEYIFETVSKVYNVSKEDLMKRTKKHIIVHPKQIFMLLATIEGYSTEQIGKFLNRHHTTPIYGRKTAINDISNDETKRNLFYFTWDIIFINCPRPSINELKEKYYDIKQII